MTFGTISRSRLKNREGYALVTVLVVLVALGFVGAAAAIMSANDTRVSGVYAFSNRAGAAAHGGLEHAAGHLVANGATSGWPVTGTLNGYSYTVTVEPDSWDFGLGAVPVHWDPTVGYNGTGVGQQVYLLESTASRDPFRATQRLQMIAHELSIESEAAFSSNSGINLRGDITISGYNHDMDGDIVDEDDLTYTGACAENKPAIQMSDPAEEVDDGGSTDLEGNETFQPTDYVKYGSTTAWHTPEEVLGLPEGALDSYKQSGEQYNENPPDTLSGITYVTDDFGSTGAGSNNIQGTGVLIVHNPLFNPREHDPADPLYDPAKASDPAYAPANIGNVNDGTFHGVIIADKIDKIDGDVLIYGSVVSLTEIDVNIIGAGTAEIRYSCETITTITESILVPLRLAWVAD